MNILDERVLIECKTFGTDENKGKIKEWRHGNLRKEYAEIFRKRNLADNFQERNKQRIDKDGRHGKIVGRKE